MSRINGIFTIGQKINWLTLKEINYNIARFLLQKSNSMRRIFVYVMCAAMLMGVSSCSTAYKPYQTGDSYTHRKRNNKKLFISKKHLFERGKDKGEPFW